MEFLIISLKSHGRDSGWLLPSTLYVQREIQGKEESYRSRQWTDNDHGATLRRRQRLFVDVACAPSRIPSYFLTREDPATVIFFLKRREREREGERERGREGEFATIEREISLHGESFRSNDLINIIKETGSWRRGPRHGTPRPLYHPLYLYRPIIAAIAQRGC